MGSKGGAHQAGCCLLKVLADRKGTVTSTHREQTGLMRPEGEGRASQSEWNS